MKVIHRKVAAAHHRRYSYSVGSPCTPSTARSGYAHSGAGELTRGHSVSAYIASFGHGGGSAAGSPFAASAFVGGQLQPLYSANGLVQSSNGGESRPPSNHGPQHQKLQHAIDAPGSRAASSIGFHSSPGMLQHSNGNMDVPSSEGVGHQQQQDQQSSDFLLPVDLQPSALMHTVNPHLHTAVGPQQEPSFSSPAEAAGAGAPSLLSAAGNHTDSADGVVALISVTGDGLGPEKKLQSAASAAGHFAAAATAEADPVVAGADGSSAGAAHPAPTAHPPPVASVLPRQPMHKPHLSIDNLTISRLASGAAGSFTSGALSPMPIAAVVADAQTAELMREMAVMKKLDHPNVVALHEVIHDPDAKVLIMVMDFMPGGPLLSSVGQGMTEPLPETAARRYFRELVSGLDYLHFNLIVHGDLKPDNLLLSAEGQLKISDFGSATLLPSADSLVSSTPGTPAFMAPEMCGYKSTPYKPFPAECWALGVCLYMFIYGKVPFSAPSTGILYEHIRSPQPIELPQEPSVSADLRTLLKGLLDKNPEMRLSIEQVSCHDWVTNHGGLPCLRCCSQQQEEGSVSPVGVGVSKAEQKNALSGLKQQVKEAIPAVEERTYRRGQVLVQQGVVPEGLYLILRGECELVISNILQEPNSAADACGVQVSGLSVAAVKKDSDMDFAGQLSSSSDSNEDEDVDQEDEEDGSYSPLARSLNASAIKIAQAAMAAVAGVDGSSGSVWLSRQQQEQQLAEQQLGQTEAGLTNNAAGADAAGQSAGTADTVSLDHILPQLLPPPRWPGAAAAGGGCHPASSSDCGAASTSASELAAAAAAARNASKSSGPVLLGAAGSVLQAASGQQAGNDVSGSPPGSPGTAGRGPQQSMSIGYAQSAMSEAYTSQDPADRGSNYSPRSSAYTPASPFLSSRSPSPIPPGAVQNLRYQNLAQASAPDLRQVLHGHRSFLMDSIGRPGSPGAAAAGDMRPGSPSGVFVQRSASSASMGRAFNRAMRRSESMHKRMKQLVDQAKMITEHNQKRQELVGIRGPGHVVGDLSLGSKALPASATVRARTRMRVLMVRRAEAAALKHQPSVKAALCRTQTASFVLEALENFATYDGEVTAIDELRKSFAATSQSFNTAQFAASCSLAKGMGPGPLLAAAAAAAGDDTAPGSFSGPTGLVPGLLSRMPGGGLNQSGSSFAAAAAAVASSGSSSPILGHPAAASPGPGSSVSAGSFTAMGALQAASRGDSFSTATALSGQSSSDFSQAFNSPRRTVTPGHITPSSSMGLHGTSSHMLPAAAGVLPSRGSSSTRFALSAASGSQPHSTQLSPMPSATAASFAAAGGLKQISKHILSGRKLQAQ